MMNELKAPLYYKVIGLGIVPLFFGVLSTAPVTVSAADESAGSQATQTSQQTAVASTTADSNSTKQSANPGAGTTTGTITPKVAPEATPTATVDQRPTSNSGTATDQTSQSSKPAGQATGQTVTDQSAADQPARNNAAAGQSIAGKKTTDSAIGTAAKQTPATSSTNSETPGQSTATSETAASPTSTTSDNQKQVQPNTIDNSTAVNKPQALTGTQLTEYEQLVKSYVSTYDQQYQTDYQAGATTSGGGRIQTQLTSKETADEQTLYSHLNQFLDQFAADECRYLLTNLDAAGVDLAFNLLTATGTSVNAGKTLVIPVKVAAVDQAGQVLQTTQLKDDQGNDLAYGGSWTTTPPTIDGYTAVTTVLPTDASGVWDDHFNYDILNADGDLVITYSYVKNAVALTPSDSEPQSQPTPPASTPTVTTPTVTTSPTTQPTDVTPAPVVTPIPSDEVPESQPAPVTVVHQPKGTELPANPGMSPQPKTPTQDLVTVLTQHASKSEAPVTSRPVVVGTQPITWMPTTAAAVEQAATSEKSPAAATKHHPRSKQSTSQPQKGDEIASLAALQRRLDQSVSLAQNAGSTAVIMNPMLVPRSVPSRFPGEGGGHTQLGLYLASLAGTINFGLRDE
nr:MucBP domain-containing protein [Lentilactobacillus parafarraginis]